MANTARIDTATARAARRRGPARGMALALALGAVLALGLAAGAARGLARPAAVAPAPAASANPFANDPHNYTVWDFREDHRASATGGALDAEQEERGRVAPGAAPAPARPTPFAGPCRAGGSDCLPDGDPPGPTRKERTMYDRNEYDLRFASHRERVAAIDRHAWRDVPPPRPAIRRPLAALLRVLAARLDPAAATPPASPAQAEASGG